METLLQIIAYIRENYHKNGLRLTQNESTGKRNASRYRGFTNVILGLTQTQI